MKKGRIKQEQLTRQNLATPFPIETLPQRLIKDNVIDLRDNYIIHDMGRSYIKIDPINDKKFF